MSYLRRCLLLLLIWGAIAGPSAAQRDTEAANYALQLYPIYQHAARTGDWSPFLQACSIDPVMTRKMFLAAAEYSDRQAATDPVGSQETWRFATAIAEAISGFGDPGAMALVIAYNSGRYNREQIKEMALKYAEPLYPELARSKVAFNEFNLATQRYGEYDVDTGLMNAEDLNLFRPLYKAFANLQLTVTFASLDQGIEQVDIATRLIEELQGKLRSRSTAPWMGEVLEVFRTGLLTYKTAIDCELGLLQKAEVMLPSLLDRPENLNWRAAALLSCARTAQAQGKTELASDYLKRARARLQPFVPPPLEYALRTAEYEARLRAGYQPSPAETVREMKKAWQAFAGYRPFERFRADGYWFYGRKATRFWLHQLEPGSAEGQEICRFISSQLDGWEVRVPGFQRDADEILFNAEQPATFLTTFMALFEQKLSVDEVRSDRAPDITSSMVEKDVLPLTRMVPTLFGSELDLTRSGLYCQMLGRACLLDARDGSLPTAQRLALVEKGVQQVALSREADAVFSSLITAGTICQQAGRPDLATANWKKALQHAERVGFLPSAAEAAALLAQEYGRLGQWQEAAVFADKATQKLEAGVALVAGDRDASRRMARTADQVAEVSVKAAIKSEQPEKALAALVKGKEAQSAAAQLRSRGEAQTEVTAVAQQEQEVAVLAEQVKTLEAMPASPTRDELLASTQNLLADTKAEFLKTSREIRQKYPHLYSQVLRFDPLDLPTVQKILPPDTAVVQYFPTDDGLYLFLVTRDAFRLRTVPVSEEQLDQAIMSFVRGVRRGGSADPRLAAQSKALYAQLIEPCAADLEGKTTLVLIPSGQLNLLPFACLTDAAGSPLIDNKLILELAQPTDFMRISLNPPGKVEQVVAFANATGDLPAAAKEGEEIAALFPGSKLFKEQQANKKNFFAFGAQAQVLHLATHGESNPENSLANYLAMSGNEKISQEEIFALGLEATSIVTLSACNTAVGDNLDSKFVASLAEAFWLGGSQTVIASLWSVNDDSTSLLMTEFYSGLRDGKGKAQALKDAQLKVKATEGYEHPYYWAGFLLFGDWR